MLLLLDAKVSFCEADRHWVVGQIDWSALAHQKDLNSICLWWLQFPGWTKSPHSSLPCSLSLSIPSSLKSCHLISLLNRGGSCPVTFVCLRPSLYSCEPHHAPAKNGLFFWDTGCVRFSWNSIICTSSPATSKPKLGKQSFLFKSVSSLILICPLDERCKWVHFEDKLHFFFFKGVQRWKQIHKKRVQEHTACFHLGVVRKITGRLWWPDM